MVHYHRPAHRAHGQSQWRNQMQTDDSSNGTTMRVVLGNADFAVVRRPVDVCKLRLDPQNPRLGYLLRQNRKGIPTTDDALHKMLWDIDQVKALAQSIYQNGGL